MEFVKKNKSFGYSGYIEIDNSKYFCRSAIECMYILYYKKMYKEYTIKMENKIFYFDGYSYKPDILLYKNNILEKIIEVKYDKKYNNKDKYDKFKKYAKKLNIDFEIVFSNHKILKDNDDIKERLEHWKKYESGINIDLRGSRNPMFGITHNNNTKNKIGLKTKERCQNKEYLSKLKMSLKKSDEQKNNCRKSALNRQKLIRENKLKNNPIEKRICIICSSEFECFKNDNKKTCKNSCTYKMKYQLGLIKKPNIDRIRTYKIRIFNYLSEYYLRIEKINYEQFQIFITDLKTEKKLPKTLGLNESTIIKYFQNYENLKNELLDYVSKKNNKTKNS